MRFPFINARIEQSRSLFGPSIDGLNSVLTYLVTARTRQAQILRARGATLRARNNMIEMKCLTRYALRGVAIFAAIACPACNL